MAKRKTVRKSLEGWTVGIDLGDRTSELCVLDTEGHVAERLRVATRPGCSAAVLEEYAGTRVTISLRLPAFILDDLKRLAHQRDVPYQSLVKILLAESLKRESAGSAA